MDKSIIIFEIVPKLLLTAAIDVKRNLKFIEY